MLPEDTQIERLVSSRRQWRHHDHHHDLVQRASNDAPEMTGNCASLPKPRVLTSEVSTSDVACRRASRLNTTRHQGQRGAPLDSGKRASGSGGYLLTASKRAKSQSHERTTTQNRRQQEITIRLVNANSIHDLLERRDDRCVASSSSNIVVIIISTHRGTTTATVGWAAASSTTAHSRR